MEYVKLNLIKFQILIFFLLEYIICDIDNGISFFINSVGQKNPVGECKNEFREFCNPSEIT